MSVESVAAAPRPRHWWSPAPAEPGRPISARRAYLVVLGVFAAFFGSGVVAAVIDVLGHRPARPDLGWADVAPALLGTIAATSVAVAMVVLLSGRRQRTVADLGLTRGRLSLSSGIRVAAWAVLGLIAGAVVTSALASSGFPFGPQGYPQLAYDMVSSVRAGVEEEIVVLAFVVVTLSQARRPPAEIIWVALVLRVSYHVYYGFGSVGILIWAGVFLWLFLRTRSLVPLIVVHIAWDTFGFLTHRWHGVAAVWGLLILALFITAPILWLAERVGRDRRPPPPQLPPPGWYLDPGGSGGHRYWDGRTWTAASAPAIPTG